MDKYPINLGHTLVIPKLHYDTLLLMPPKEVGGLYSLVTIIAKAVVSAVNADGFNVGQNNGRQLIKLFHMCMFILFLDLMTIVQTENGLREVLHPHEDLLEIAYKIKGLLNSILTDDKLDFTLLSSRKEKQ